jgi:hypothetical protein
MGVKKRLPALKNNFRWLALSMSVLNHKHIGTRSITP